MHLIRKTFLLFLLLLSITISRHGVYAQSSLTLELNTTVEQNIDLAYLNKITFQDSNLLLTYIDGSSESYTLSSIRKIFFDVLVTNIEGSVEKSTLWNVFPNPAVDVIYLEGPQGLSVWVSIHRLDGQIIKNLGEMVTNERIDISFLIPGIYFLKLNNHTIKLLKR